ncbi:FlgM family anti-sigma-28 factor [Edaphobacter aggregans]|jgi:negative regulator of flagellin synthesis FlgM|uniref:Negative regulator of flagellin synthesis n=1 Tax=Edaphobacter aggregans TaxID=570835 RepID=A0A428MDA7_9BACT|nr:flagellar biosynthesis anti-sigma factor FlgM [Edaphobacter aggregans]RSL14876.1 FlgM family anti-sigma-28 factor [Edaphobacter aggregans]
MSYSNEIGGLQRGLNPIAATGTTQTNTPAAATKTNDASTEQVDQAKLSLMGGLVSQALGGSDVRMDKVAKLQQAITSGSYSVSSSDVAEKMIDSLLE